MLCNALAKANPQWGDLERGEGHTTYTVVNSDFI